MANDETKRVHVMCPTCRAQADFHVPTYIFHQDGNGLANIQIQTGDVCQHQFLISIDQKFNVRGTEKIDFQVTLAPQKENVAELAIGDILPRFKSYNTICLFHAVIFGYPIQLVTTILDTPTLSQDLLTLFKSILPLAWQASLDITQIFKKDFQNLQRTQEGVFVLDTKGIVINTPWTKDRMIFEQNLLSAAMAFDGPDAQLSAIKKSVDALRSFTQEAADLVRGKELIFDEDLELFIAAKSPIKKTAGFLEYLLKLFDRRCQDSKILRQKVHIKPVDVMTKSFWS
jgi:hypothetical protein